MLKNIFKWLVCSVACYMILNLVLEFSFDVIIYSMLLGYLVWCLNEIYNKLVIIDRRTKKIIKKLRKNRVYIDGGDNTLEAIVERFKPIKDEQKPI